MKVGVIALLNEAGRVVRRSQWYVAMRGAPDQFRVRLRRAATARGVRKIDVVVVISDGAKWLRALATRHFEWAVAVRDFFHAVQHLGVMGEAHYGKGSSRAIVWQAAMAHRLKHEGAAALVPEWEKMGGRAKDRKVWERELMYFRSQQEAMAYAEFREQNLPIGSGAVEGGGRSVVGMRYKIPGARWTEEGAQNLLPLRVRYCNGLPLVP